MENEQWLPVRHFEKLYKISNKGDVYSETTKKKLTPATIKSGKKYICLRGNNINEKNKSYEIGFLVAMAFKHDSHRNEQKVDHINGNNSDNDVENLVWSDKRHPNFAI
jgi:hypothetical protein